MLPHDRMFPIDHAVASTECSRRISSGEGGLCRPLMRESPRIAQRIRGRRLGPALGGAEHKLPGHVSPPDFQTTLHCAEQPVRIGAGMGGLKFGEEVASGLRPVLVEPCPQFGRHRYKGVGRRR